MIPDERTISLENNKFVLRIRTRESIADSLRVPKIAGHTVTSLPETECAPEDIPAALELRMPGLRYMTEITVEPAPGESDKKRFCEFARNASNGGAVEYPEGEKVRFDHCGSVTSFRALTRYSEKLYLTVWFSGSPDMTKVAETLEECLPYAIPSKYGFCEPPEYGYEENGGAAGFADFLKKDGFHVIYTEHPVTHFFTGAPGKKKAGFITLAMSSEVWERENWKNALGRLLRRLGSAVNAFFGQIVIGDRPVAAGAWQGIPVALGEACVIGGEYPGLIPGCRPEDVERPDGQNAGRYCKNEGNGFSETATGLLFYEEPYGPLIDKKYLSMRKKSIFGKEKGIGREYPEAGDFTVADSIPSGCFDAE